MPPSRRDFLNQLGGGFGSLALAGMLAQDARAETAGADQADASTRAGEASSPADWPLGGVHHPAKVRRVIQLFMNGGVSQMDTFDHKPELDRRHGESIDFGIRAAVTSPVGTIMRSPFGFQRHGECGRWVSDVFPHMATCVDDLAFLMAMASKTNVHGPASYMQNTGFVSPGFPCMGAWISYGLGRISDDLPTFVVLPDHRGLPYNNTGNFSAAFLPAAHQGVIIKPNAPEPIGNLSPPEFADITPAAEADGLALLDRLNRRHEAGREDDTRLAARIASFELAAKMQVAAPHALDLSDETAATHREYGIDEDETAPFARNCLTARRLIERGVRFVQVWSGMGGPSKNWDNHSDIITELPFIARSVDRPIAALMKDLKRRGLLEDTLVVWTTEFGRMPFTQGATGRDHNGGTSVTWLSGGGVRGGVTHGVSDEFSYTGAEGITYCYDLHATILHLLGIDHKRLTFRHNGIDRRLTDVHGHVIREILHS
ncbi:MAG: DUF1501 domain-containing protein [Planctomycetaceae bacterium]|nr:MAG: DUF1501 domain-containing protein [Planctomycetaceae bacterium]